VKPGCEEKTMQPPHQRRSCRIAQSIPIRVFATDFRGIEFVEDATTLVVNLHGAKIRLIRQLIPDQEFCLHSFPTRQEAVFRVVSKAPGSEGACTFWGVECLNPERNIWGIRFPELQTRDQGAVRVMLQCPHCHDRELVFLDEPSLQALEDAGGLVRPCLPCMQTSLWKIVPYFEN
jgi:hypothetical protein